MQKNLHVPKIQREKDKHERRIQYNDKLHASITSRPSRLSRPGVLIWNLVCHDKHVPMIDEIFPKSNYKFWRLTKTSYKPPGHQGQANLRSRHSASEVPIWNLWSRQRLPSPSVVLTHTQDKVDRPVGKSPRKTLPQLPVWIPPLKLKSLFVIIPWNHWEWLHNSFHRNLSFFSIQDHVLFLVHWCWPHAHFY